MKKGIELSINFLVTIVIALVIFIFGVKFIYDLAGEATEIESLTTDQLDTKIGHLLCESTDRVCIGVDKKTIPKGELDIFGIKIINIDTTQQFEISITPTKLIRNDEEKGFDENKIKIRHRTVTTIQRNKEASIGVGVEVLRSAESGLYILDVEIKRGDGELYSGLHKLYVEVP